jgi:UDP-N-acetyl-D-glucosamine/UDP-N-acetyl-D-galactosamine dehydrogenase
MKKVDDIISVIGLGYVGLPVAVAFAQKFRVIAFDINPSRLTELRSGQDRTEEVDSEELLKAKLQFTDNPDDLRQATIHIIAVPTPINEAKQPDLTPLLKATETVGKILKAGDMVIFESTVYPGCTEEDCAPLLEKLSGLKYLSSDPSSVLREEGARNADESEGFTLGYSPERINPGDKEHTFSTICKVVSGSTPKALERVTILYGSVISAGIHQASTIKVAEAAKVIENAQRDLNIAFMNELAMIFERLGVDTHEVLEAAGTKWNFLPFRPGLVGGHCIGVDPYYLTHRAEKAGFHPQVIISGRIINDNMGAFVAEQTLKTMAAAGIGAMGSKVTILGLTFKEDCPDLRNSKVPDIIHELRQYGCDIQVHDPRCDPQEAKKEFGLQLTPQENLGQASVLILAVAHKLYRDWTSKEWIKLLLPQGVVTDVKNIVPVQQLKESGYRVWKL